MTSPDALPILYWSIRGEVACAAHVPIDARWKTDVWQPIPANKVGIFHCQHCAADHTAITFPRSDPFSTSS